MPRQATILVADDDPNDLLFLELAVKKSGLGHLVRTVRDGEEAIDYLSGNPPFTDRTQAPLPDLFLLDLKMPKKNGFEVLLWLQGQESVRQIPVVVLSGSALETDKEEAIALGAREYRVKPFVEELVGLVKELDARWLCNNAR